MSPVYHVTSLFPSTSVATPAKFEARIALIGRRLEGYIRSRLWDRCRQPDDLDDGVQIALLRLWQRYQQEPWIMDLDDLWWLKRGVGFATSALKSLRAQCGITHANGVECCEFPASHLAPDDNEADGLELAEMKHIRLTMPARRVESELTDRRLDLEQLLDQAIIQLPHQYRQPVRTLIPYIAQGYPFIEAARRGGIDRTKANRAWKAFQAAACAIANTSGGQQKGKGYRAQPDEYEAIRTLAAQGISLPKIAEQLGRTKSFVNTHFEAATGYRRGSNKDTKPVTAEKIAAMRELRVQGLAYAAIAREVGCSTGSVFAKLNG